MSKLESNIRRRTRFGLEVEDKVSRWSSGNGLRVGRLLERPDATLQLEIRGFSKFETLMECQ